MNKRFSEIYQHGQQSDKLENRQIDDNDAIYMKRTILSGNNKRLKDLIPDTEKRQNDEDTIYVKRISGVNGRIGDSRVHVKQPSKRYADQDGVVFKGGERVHSKQPSKRQIDDEASYVERTILTDDNQRLKNLVHARQNDDEDANYVKRDSLGVKGLADERAHLK
jgi:hypothetical protein